LLIVQGEQEAPPTMVLAEAGTFDEGVQEALRHLQDRPSAEKEEAGGIDNFFVLTDRDGNEEPFIPGSSLKGVLRQRAEQLARTMGRGCCDPFAGPEDVVEEKDISCSVRIERRRKALADRGETLPGHEVYRMACPICKLFGCLGLAARIQVSDGYLVDDAFHLTSRDGVGIDRRRGGAREKAKFRNEVLETGRFRTRLHLRNYELWQLGLMAYLLDDLVCGQIRLGHGTHRGLGKITAETQEVTVTTFGRRALEAQSNKVELLGAGQLAAETGLPHAEAYGFQSDDGVRIDGAVGERDGLRYVWELPPAQQEQLWAAVALLWRTPVSPTDGGEEG
jgi:CRISPR-associated RAMP protein (TIGR02581 family)